MPNSHRHNQILTDLGSTQLVATSSLQFPRSLRNYTSAVIKKSARFIETFGLRLPVLLDSERNVIAGEIWALAARWLELPEIPALFVEGLSSDQVNAYRIGLQRIPELGTWDEQALSEIFQDWSELSLPGFLEHPPPPPVDGSAPKDMLNHAHANLLCYRRVIQSRFNSPAGAGRLSHLNGLGICWLGREGSNPPIIRCCTKTFPYRPAGLIPSLIPKPPTLPSL